MHGRWMLPLLEVRIVASLNTEAQASVWMCALILWGGRSLWCSNTVFPHREAAGHVEESRVGAEATFVSRVQLLQETLAFRSDE